MIPAGHDGRGLGTRLQYDIWLTISWCDAVTNDEKARGKKITLTNSEK